MLSSLIFSIALSSSLPTPVAQPAVLNDPIVCSQFKPPTSLIKQNRKRDDYFPGDLYFVQGRYKDAFVAYYASIFCHAKAYPFTTEQALQFGDSLGDIQVGLTAAIAGQYDTAEGHFLTAASEMGGKGAALFFKGDCEWAKGNRKKASRDWLTSASSPGMPLPPDVKRTEPAFAFSAANLLKSLTGIAPRRWKD